MIYDFTAFAGFEAAAALGEEAKNSRRSVPVSIVGIVVVTGIYYLLVVCAEAFAAGRHGIAGLIGQASPLGYLTSRFWSPSVLWSIDLVIVLAASASSWPRSTRRSGSCTRWDANGPCPGRSAGCRTAGPQ